MDNTAWLFSPERKSTDPAEVLYQIYPRKVGRPHALRAIRRALRYYGYDHLRAATQTYRDRAKNINPQFIPYPATWFNQERFNDDPATWSASSGASLSIWELSKILELKEERARTIKDRWSYDGCWTDPAKFDEFKKLRQEITALKSRMETMG